MCINVYLKYYKHVCYQVVFKGFNNLNLFALQQPKVDRKGENPAGGVVPQETTCAFGDDTSTGHDYISDDGSPSMVCMCVSCVGVKCNIFCAPHST